MADEHATSASNPLHVHHGPGATPNPAPPPFNPLSGQETVVDLSVVPSLMQVYESMTSQKTATTANTENSNRVGNNNNKRANSEHHYHPRSYTPADPSSAEASSSGEPWTTTTTYDGGVNSAIPIPPLPDAAAFMTDAVVDPSGLPTTATAAAAAAAAAAVGVGTTVPPSAVSQTPAAPPQPPQRSVPTTSGGGGSSFGHAPTGRSLRKRTSNIQGLKDDSAHCVGSGSGGGGGGGGGGRSSKSRRKGGAGASPGGSGLAGGNGGSAGGAAGAGGSGNGGQGGGKDNDGRWSKRFSWPEDLHRDFVAAIFDVGLKHSSPSTLLEQMPKHEQITTERIKSHLQKYRLHRVKSKKEFMSTYDASLKKLKDTGVSGLTSLSGGEVAGHLSYVSMNDNTATSAGGSTSNSLEAENEGRTTGKPVVASKTPADQNGVPKPGARDPVSARASSLHQNQSNQHEALMLPRLTDQEKKSPIGASMGYLMGLFFSLKQQLMAQRAAEKSNTTASTSTTTKPTDATTVYNSFVAGQTPVPTTSSGASTGGAAMDPLAVVATATSNPLATTSSHHQAVPVGNTSTPPSTRTNLEENNMMKREMESQMAFQNKMRALKQQELNKYKVPVQSASRITVASDETHRIRHTENKQTYNTSTPGGSHLGPAEVASAVETTSTQGAGETAVSIVSSTAGNTNPGTTTRGRGMSLGVVEEFWNTDIVDDQLFEFLMSDG